MRINNKRYSALITFTVLLVSIQSVQTNIRKHARYINDIDTLVFKQQQQANYLSAQIGHHPAKLRVNLNNERSWIKQGFCKICDETIGQCNQSCFNQKQQTKLSCDSSFCDKLGQYSDQEQGIEGLEGQVFIKVSNNKQVLMNLIFATKLYEKHSQLGNFNVFDSQSSFSNGMLIKNPRNNIQLLNVKQILAQDLKKYKQNVGNILQLNVENQQQFNFDFLKVNKVSIHNIDFEKYNDININVSNFQIEFTLQYQAIALPPKLFRKLEKQLLQQYFVNQSCKLIQKKIQCDQQIHLQPLYESFFILSINQHTLSIPFRLLFTGCSKNECNHLLDINPNASTVSVGTILWSIFNLEYNVEAKYFTFYRKNNQWSTLYSQQQRINPQKIGFFRALMRLIYVIFVLIFKVIFLLVIVSLMINFVIHYRKILIWIKMVLLRIKQRKRGTALDDHEDKQYLSGRVKRRIHRLPDFQQDSQIIV